MNILFIIIAVAVMIIGFIGTFVPAIPGTVLVFASALVYGIITKFNDITVTMINIFGILTLAAVILDYAASLITTKKVGASRYGIIGAVVGGIIGFIVFNIFGLIIGQSVGAVVGELLRNRDLDSSIKIGFATFVGYILGVVANSTISLIIIVSFLLKVIF